jgi:hypothetical protein
MQKLDIQNIEKIRQENPLLAEALESIANEVAHVADQTTATIGGSTAAPPAPTSVNVVASGGIHDIAITDRNPVNRGINYFVEYSDSPSFVAPRVIDLGASRNHRTALGNQTLYFRAYSAYPTSPRSAAVYHGGSASSPAAVIGGGSATGPAPQASQGSGTTNGANGGDGGFGNQPSRGPR